MGKRGGYMKVRVMFVLILSVFMLQGCNSGCSQEDMVAKAQRISERMQQLATDDPKSLLELVVVGDKLKVIRLIQIPVKFVQLMMTFWPSLTSP